MIIDAIGPIPTSKESERMKEKEKITKREQQHRQKFVSEICKLDYYKTVPCTCNCFEDGKIPSGHVHGLEFYIEPLALCLWHYLVWVFYIDFCFQLQTQRRKENMSYLEEYLDD